MAIKLGNTNDVALNGVKIIVYGDSGAGKTTLMGTAPRPLIISAEAGLLALRGSNIPYISVTTYSELMEAYSYATSDEGRALYDTLCLDSISEIADIILANAKANNKDSRQAYGELNDTYADLLRAFRNIEGKNVVFSAKMERTTLSDGTTKFSTSLPGVKTSQNTPYFFDEVFCLQVVRGENGEISRWLQTGSDDLYLAKDRSGVLDMWEEPNLTRIIEKITR